MKLAAIFFGMMGMLGLGEATAAGTDIKATFETARRQTVAVLETIAGAVAPSADAQVQLDSLGANLAHYANNPGSDPGRFESTAEAARRILAGGSAQKRAPDVTSQWLDEAADQLLAAVTAAEAALGPTRDARLDAVIVNMRSCAYLARFHARRLIAAVHFNLFKRGLRLAELVAATYAEKEAVAAWRELIAQAGPHPLAATWRAELKKLEAQLKDLEEQCCPPDEAILKEKVWQPRAGRASKAK